MRFCGTARTSGKKNNRKANGLVSIMVFSTAIAASLYALEEHPTTLTLKPVCTLVTTLAVTSKFTPSEESVWSTKPINGRA